MFSFVQENIKNSGIAQELQRKIHTVIVTVAGPSPLTSPGLCRFWIAGELSPRLSALPLPPPPPPIRRVGHLTGVGLWHGAEVVI
jgi:hypothetical protein